MTIILTPRKREPNRLQAAYDHAAKYATELYIATAYLTKWPISSPLSDHCKKIYIIAGTDFGATRRQALRDALKWLPPRFKNQLFAFKTDRDRSFHPKLLIWREGSGQHYCLVGSANLTEAAFESNYEAAYEAEMKKSDFDAALSWIRELTDYSDTVNNAFIANYIERKQPSRKTASPIKKRNVKRTKIPKKLPQDPKFIDYLEGRRVQMKEFQKISKKLKKLTQECASGGLSSRLYYKEMTALWKRSKFDPRSAWAIHGKGANWKEACKSLQHILDAERVTSIAKLDEIVQEEIDRLAQKKNSARRAWFTQMLCQFFPRHYAVNNSPVRKFIEDSGETINRGSEGAKYIGLVRHLRSKLKSSPVKNLGELDILIWHHMDKKK